jgi:molybdopterin adenylyltransferase
MFRVGVITVSDKGSRGEREDLSGPILIKLVQDLDWEVVEYVVLPDDQILLAEKMRQWTDELCLDLIFTTGGTGFAMRDVTPEATLSVADRLVPGIAEVMRLESLKVTSRAMLSRAVAVLRKQTLIINMPGSPKALRECFEAIAPAIGHGIQILKGEAGECATTIK